MYYVELIDRFWLFSKKAKPGTAAISLYLYLLQLAKEKNAYQFVISDVNLGKSLGVSRATVRTTREKLRKFGLIDYRSMQGVAGIYRLIVNYKLESTNFEKVQNDSASEIINFFGKNGNDLKSEEIAQKHNVPGTDDLNMLVEPSRLLTDGRVVPGLQEFLDYARTLDAYNPELDNLIMAKHSGWLKSNWKSASGRPIINWQSSLKNVLSFLSSEVGQNELTVDDLPEIRHPKEQL